MRPREPIYSCALAVDKSIVETAKFKGKSRMVFNIHALEFIARKITSIIDLTTVRYRIGGFYNAVIG